MTVKPEQNKNLPLSISCIKKSRIYESSKYWFFFWLKHFTCNFWLNVGETLSSRPLSRSMTKITPLNCCRGLFMYNSHTMF